MFGFWKESFGLIETVDADLTVSFFNTNWDISSNNIYVDIKHFTEDSNHIDISTRTITIGSIQFYLNTKCINRKKLKTCYEYHFTTLFQIMGIVWNIFYRCGSTIGAFILKMTAEEN